MKHFQQPRNLALGAVVLCVALVLGGFWLARPKSLAEKHHLAEILSDESLKPQVTVTNKNPTDKMVDQLNREMSTEAQSATAKKIDPAVSSIMQESDRQFLKEFSKIKSKVFQSQGDESRRLEILEDTHLIQNVGQALKNPKELASVEFAENENTMIDYLIEAFKDGDTDVALLAIKDILQDAQVENPQVENSLRETHAGIKAELLYQLSSFSPDSIAEISALLPGPVSQKIWQNVQAQQNENLNESLKEKQSFENQK